MKCRFVAILFCLVILVITNRVYAQGLTLASIPDQPVIEAEQNGTSNLPVFNTYNFTHLDLENGNDLYNFPGIEREPNNAHIGGITTFVGIGALIVGMIGMSDIYGGKELNGPAPPMSPRQRNSFNTYKGVAIAGGSIMTVGIIIALANGEVHSVGYSEGFYSNSSRGRHHYRLHSGHSNHSHSGSRGPRRSSGTRSTRAHTPKQVGSRKK